MELERKHLTWEVNENKLRLEELRKDVELLRPEIIRERRISHCGVNLVSPLVYGVNVCSLPPPPDRPSIGSLTCDYSLLEMA